MAGKRTKALPSKRNRRSARLWTVVLALGLSFLPVVHQAPAIEANKGSEEQFTTIAECSVENKYTADSNNVISDEASRSLLVTTLDGKFWALNTNSDGAETWSDVLGPGPLLSSTIGDIEFEHNGMLFRLIPSLDGSLYRYSGQAVEPIPLDAEMLLKNSYRLGDDTVITGGKESRTFGIDLLTGRKIYECGFSGCYQPDGVKPENDSRRDVLMVERHSHVVRAVEPRTGSERWNFKVGDYKVWLLNSAKKCRMPGDQEHNDEKMPDNREVRVVVPDGYVSLVNTETKQEEWSRKFDSPIVGVWEIKDGHVRQVDLFNKKTLLGLDVDSNEDQSEPTIYLGSHRGQIYVQHSRTFDKLIKKQRQIERYGDTNLAINADRKKVLQIEWNPRPAREHDELDDDGNEPTDSTTALVPVQLTSANVERGYYLFRDLVDEAPPCPESTASNISNKNIIREEFNETMSSDSFDQVIIVSLWHWWREVLTLSIIGAFAFNYGYAVLKRKWRRVVIECAEACVEKLKAEEKDLPGRSVEEGSDNEVLVEPCPPLNTPGHSRTPSLQLQIPQISLPSTDSNDSTYTPHTAGPSSLSTEFMSRYLADFDHVRCLGRGGFGVVFEAKNKLDDCNYAIKRIRIPFKAQAREKVKREVKALAKLDHCGIVRFYYSWIEEPPEGWQEAKDKELDLTTTTSELDTNSQFTGFSHDLPATINTTTTNDEVTTDRSRSNFGCAALSDDNDSYVQFESSERENCTDGDAGDDGAEDFSEDRVEKFESKRIKAQDSVDSGISAPKAYLYIQMQLCRKSTLKEWLFANSTSRDSEIVSDIFRQIVSAVDYVHAQGLMHRDLKPSNIFFSQDGIVKIGDFGLVTANVENSIRTPAGDGDGADNRARKISVLEKFSNHTDKVGTCLYMSPEQLIGVLYSNKVDIFSLGVIYFELLVPFGTEMERIVTLRDARERRFPDEFNSDKRELLQELLAQNPDYRPTASEIKKRLFGNHLDPLDADANRRRRTLSSSLNAEE